MLDQQAVERIITHMNEDHADAILLYARAFGGSTGATRARLVVFGADGMSIVCDEPGGETECRIDFDKPLTHAGEARELLVSLVEKARAQLGTR